jgi:hypothetical protein
MNDLVLAGLARDAAEAVSEKFHVALAATIRATAPSLRALTSEAIV